MKGKCGCGGRGDELSAAGRLSVDVPHLLSTTFQQAEECGTIVCVPALFRLQHAESKAAVRGRGGKTRTGQKQRMCRLADKNLVPGTASSQTPSL